MEDCVEDETFVEGTCLHVNTTLKRFGMSGIICTIDQKCHLCEDVETRQHMTFKCKWTKHRWLTTMNLRAYLASEENIFSCSNLVALDARVPKKENEHRWGKYGIVCRSKWKKTCRALFDCKDPNPAKVIDSFKRDHQTLWWIVYKRTRDTTGDAPREDKWTKPNERVVNINCDDS